MASPIPVVPSLASAYGDDSTAAAAVEGRVQLLTERFERLYGCKPTILSRAPGRVNLIGEHIDYEGYAVLPMAIELDTIVAVSVASLSSSDSGAASSAAAADLSTHPPSSSSSSSPPLLRVANVNSEHYPPREFSTDPDQEVDLGNHSWANYFLCGYKGVFDFARQKGKGGITVQPRGLNLLVDGVVPLGSGLSSSAALVCSSSIAVMAALQLNFSQADVAELACSSERYIGTQSGGMDQAISVMARPGVALKIDFNPIRSADVILPSAAAFVVANSLAVSKKAETAATNYNNRVVECRLAAMLLAVKLGLSQKQVLRIQTLKEVEDSCRSFAAAEGKEGPAAAAAAVERLLPASFYSKPEIESALGSPLELVFESSPTSLAVLAAAANFKLQQRALHVFGEASRVHRFHRVCQEAAEKLKSNEEALLELGLLMNASHQSCSQLYECSCPELEELVACCLSNGAIGARLTGAGWGGCVVALVRKGSEDHFISQIKNSFYSSRLESGVLKPEDAGNVIFASSPGGGAVLVNL